ncbi:unnamed protein product [Taenia asiatica]|uniref:Zf-ANAPC11 domain-containing protein n=1 Tax=Taenia asiatica TaxID=60517 RepID=A0A0R3VYF3_TAEAS|nr:unnamed protein product [Taenia asiatica]
MEVDIHASPLGPLDTPHRSLQFTTSPLTNTASPIGGHSLLTRAHSTICKMPPLTQSQAALPLSMQHYQSPIHSPSTSCHSQSSSLHILTTQSCAHLNKRQDKEEVKKKEDEREEEEEKEEEEKAVMRGPLQGTLVLLVDRCHVVVKAMGMLWRKRNTQHDSPCPESPGGREGGITDDIPPPASNSPCPPPPPTQPPDETALTPQPPQERPEMEHFQLLKWNACAFWSWDVMHDTCVICRNAMMSLCELLVPSFDMA